MTRRQTIRMIVAVLAVWSIVTSVSIALARRELVNWQQRESLRMQTTTLQAVAEGEPVGDASAISSLAMGR